MSLVPSEDHSILPAINGSLISFEPSSFARYNALLSSPSLLNTTFLPSRDHEPVLIPAIAVSRCTSVPSEFITKLAGRSPTHRTNRIRPSAVKVGRSSRVGLFVNRIGVCFGVPVSAPSACSSRGRSNHDVTNPMMVNTHAATAISHLVGWLRSADGCAVETGANAGGDPPDCVISVTSATNL